MPQERKESSPYPIWLIDPPGEYSPRKEWEAYLSGLLETQKQGPEVAGPMIDSAIERAKHHIATHLPKVEAAPGNREN